MKHLRKSILTLLALTLFGGAWAQWTGNPYASFVYNDKATVVFNGMAWYVIEDNSTAVNAGTLTLFARDPLCASVFNNGNRYTNNIDQYSSSVVKTYLDGLTTGSGSFAGVADAIVPVDLADVNVTGAKLWLLSLEQAATIFKTNKFVLACTKANGTTSNLNYCWTRTKVTASPDDADHVLRNNALAFYAGDNCKVKGNVNGNSNVSVDVDGYSYSTGCWAYNSYNVRPALKLDLSEVTLSSVTVTLSGGANATTTGGGSIQRFFEVDGSTHSPIVDVYYRGGTCGTFPATSEYYTTTDGITVEYIDSKTVKVSGTPTSNNVTVTIPDAHANHTFSYTASGATITAGCTTSGCPARSSFNPVKLTIAAPTDGGISAEATLINLDAFNKATNLSISTSNVKYYNATKSGDTYTKSGDALAAAPTSVGDYLAEITVSGATASVGYTKTLIVRELTPDATGKVWTLGQTPDYDLELQVEYYEAHALKNIPAGWTVKINGVEQQTPYQGDSLMITETDSVTLVPDGNPRRVKSVTLEDEAPAVQTVHVGGIVNATFYYLPGETWLQAIENHPTENAGFSINAGKVRYNGTRVYIGSFGDLNPNTEVDPNGDYRVLQH